MAEGALLAAVARWALREAGQAWVDTVWELDFTETEPLDSRLHSLITDEGLDAFSQLYEALCPFAVDDHGTTKSIWPLLAENNISHSTIVAVLYHFVQEAQSKNAGVHQRLYALHAAGLYFLLVEIPGSIANQMDENFEEEEEGQEEGIHFSAQELLQIRTALFFLLKNLLRLLSKFSLKERPQCMQTCIQVFVNLTGFEPCIHEFEPSEKMVIDQAKYVPELAYFGLRLLCSPFHSLEDKVLRQVFHRFLSIILMLPGREGSSSASATIPSQLIGARDQAIKFISSLADELKAAVFPVLRILLQHICAKVPDKSEYRTHAAQSLVQLLYKFPCAEHADFIAWLYRYSHSDQISYRVFALDVALALLDLPERDEDTAALSEEQQMFLKHKFLVQVMVFRRCSDVAPTVRSKALSSFAQCLEMKATLSTDTFQELLQGGASSRMKTFPTFKTIEITDKQDTTQFDGKMIMNMLRLRTRDQKTNVRKSALQVLMSILKHHMVPCTPEDLAPLSERCRDSAVSVKKQALQSITELLTSQPENVLIQKAWLTGVIPVVMDSENSVQEKALDCIEQLLLQPIKHCNKFSHQDQPQVLAWALLTLFAEECQDLRQDEGQLETMVHILSVIGSTAKHLPSSIRNRVIDDIKRRLLEFQFPLLAISPAVETTQKLCIASAESPKEILALQSEVFEDILLACECYISSIVLQEHGAEQLQEDVLVKHLFTLGEAVQMCPGKVGKRTFLLIQSILASPDSMGQESSHGDNEELLPSQPLSQFQGSVMPSAVRAHAFITLGKLCLQHEDVAKKCIPALARELQVSKDVAVRNNVILVIGDLCVRYTSMADQYIPDVSVCLKDPEPFIRKQTLILLTNLLQEEFVKWKGSLFFRFVSVLVDPCEEIASLAKFCLVHLLLKRNPVMFSQHFIECIFYFNCYEKHEKYNNEKSLFSLKGKANKDKRVLIYKYLLEHFTDEQRFNITSKISLNILACFADGALPLDLEASELLSDTFEILSCREIKLSAMRSKPEDDLQPEEDELAMANAVMQVAQKKLISQVQKKNFVENVIPVVISLKALLQENRLPALRDLMNYLREVMKDYRNEIKEFFALDKQLAAELEYDMKKYEEQLEQESEQGQEPSRETDVLEPAVAVQQSPRSADQVQEASPTARRDSSLLKSPPAPAGFTVARPGVLTPRPRNVSLNTLAILNSAKMAVEAASKQRSRSLGRRPASPGSKEPFTTSCGSLNQPSSGATVPLEGRAISTPEKSISNVTFGAGVSCIALMPTPASSPGDYAATGQLPSLSPPASSKRSVLFSSRLSFEERRVVNILLRSFALSAILGGKPACTVAHGDLVSFVAACRMNWVPVLDQGTDHAVSGVQNIRVSLLSYHSVGLGA
ncbi:Condensin-2 complex subunit D3 [Varanus komodoensis]|nr:Condensin-2 complex subunit D3 [Varanus komodoensis]